MSPAAKSIQALKEWAEHTASIDRLMALERETVRSLPAAKQAVTDARRERVLAEAGTMRGLPDRRAEAAKGEQAALQALEDVERRITAAHEAVAAERAARGQFSAENRGELLGLAQAASRTVQEEAHALIDRVQGLQLTISQATEAWTPLRPVRRDLGAPIGREAHAPIDLQAVLAALVVVVDRGITAPSDVNPADGSPITAESRERERIRQPVDDARALAGGDELLEQL